MSCIQFTQSGKNIVCNDRSIPSRVPDVWFYPSFMKMISVPMAFSPNQIHSLGSIEHFHVGVVFFQLFHPGLFEADIADAQISLTSAEVDQLLRGRVVAFRTISLWYHTYHLIMVARYGFREIAEGFEGDGQYRLFVLLRCISTCATNQ